MLLHGDTLDASLTVSDLERSSSWYVDILGFTIERRHERDGQLMAVSLKAGDVRLLLSQDDGSKGLDRARGKRFPSGSPPARISTRSQHLSRSRVLPSIRNR
jgi:catechol 2,3-dioxygenase-like lactoylglutathione lyase family enzyme